MPYVENKRKESLRELVFDSIPQELKGFISRIALMQNGDKQICVITFASPLALQEWKQAEETILENMRELYKKRGLKSLLVFHQVVAEVFNSTHHTIKIKPKEQGNISMKYKERALGEFENYCTDEKLRKHFEAIRMIVKQNLNKPRQGV